MQPKKVGGQYQFTKNDNYEDYSSGRVLYGATGATNFPVRLASEIFQRAKYYLTDQGHKGPYTIYDPFCGAAYTLTVLGLLHGEDIKSLFASDADGMIIELAKKNLSLLTQAGLHNRITELELLLNSYHKDSHKAALISANTLSQHVVTTKISVGTKQYNVFEGEKPPFDFSTIDLIITDLPYGKLAKWKSSMEGINPTQQFLNHIKEYMLSKALIAISINKKQRVSYEGYSKIKSFQIGTRKVLFLQVK